MNVEWMKQKPEKLLYQNLKMNLIVCETRKQAENICYP